MLRFVLPLKCFDCDHLEFGGELAMKDHVKNLHSNANVNAVEQPRDIDNKNSDHQQETPAIASKAAANPKKQSASTIECRCCHREISNASTWNLRLHVMAVHVKKCHYDCPHCNDGGESRKSFVEKHIARSHSDRPPLAVVDNLKKSAKEIAHWTARCFPADARRTRDSFVGLKQSKASAKNAKTTEQRKTENSVQQVTDCLLCHAKVLLNYNSILHHVLYVHINKKSLYGCTRCDFGGNKLRLKEHMTKKHPDCQPQPVIDVRKKFAPEIAQWMKQCFPSVKPSLTKAAVLTMKMPKEQCRLCQKMTSVNYHDQWKHIETVHLDTKNRLWYRCPYCAFANSVRKRALAHVAREHPTNEMKLLDCVKEIDALKAEWMPKCFPIKSQNHSHPFTTTVDHNKYLQLLEKLKQKAGLSDESNSNKETPVAKADAAIRLITLTALECKKKTDTRATT